MRSAYHAVLAAAGLALVFLGVGSPRTASAQYLQTAFQFQTIQPHPYVHALGNATVAARGYPGATGVNPATVGTGEAVRVASNLNLRRGPVYSSPYGIRWIAAPSATLTKGAWAGGLQVKHFSLGSTEVRSPNGELLRTIDSYQQSIKFATAYEATPHLTVGGAVNLIRSRLGAVESEDTKVHPTVDLGVHYETRVEQDFMTVRPALGLSLTDLGDNVSHENQRGDSPLPTTVRGGGGLQVVSQSTQFHRPEWRIGLYGALSNRLVSGEYMEEDGVTYFEADGPFAALVHGWGTAKGIVGPPGQQETVGPWKRIAKHAGVEVSVLDIISLRLGRFHESDDLSGRQYTALGVGLDAYYVSLDASWNFREEVSGQRSYGRLTIRIPLSDSPCNFWPALLGNDR